jgi:hypothetical protein
MDLYWPTINPECNIHKQGRDIGQVVLLRLATIRPVDRASKDRKDDQHPDIGRIAL